MWNQDTTGVARTKPAPELYSADLGTYQDAVDYLRSLIALCGYVVVRAELDPYSRMWTFYGLDDEVSVRIEHSMIERFRALGQLWPHQ